MSIEIAYFCPADAEPDDFTEWYAMTAAAARTDSPSMPVPTVESVTARLRFPMTAPGPSLSWTARRDGDLAGTAVVHLPGAENDHTAVVAITTHPALRRTGVGTEVLRAIVPELRARRRRVVIGYVTADGDGERWARATGFRVVHRLVVQILDIAGTDPALWDVEVPRGYHLEHWSDAAPEQLVASYAMARRAVHDAPTGRSSEVIPQWTAAKIREEEEDWRARGFHHTVVAVRDRHGEVVGITEMAVHPSQPDRGMQQFTAVVPAHRGRGLGRAAKAAMMRRLTAEHPRLRRVGTSTGAENLHMIRVNGELGYATVLTAATVEADLDALPPPVHPV